MKFVTDNQLPNVLIRERRVFAFKQSFYKMQL
jgi:hypothetical protein